MLKKITKKILILIIFLAPLKSTKAASLLDVAPCVKSGDCGLNDIVSVGVNATNILLSLSGSVAILFFIYGGVTFLISGGSAEKVSKGKSIITNAVIGLIIIFTSFIIIKFSMDALGFTRSGIWYQSL